MGYSTGAPVSVGRQHQRWHHLWHHARGTCFQMGTYQAAFVRSDFKRMHSAAMDAGDRTYADTISTHQLDELWGDRRAAVPHAAGRLVLALRRDRSLCRGRCAETWKSWGSVARDVTCSPQAVPAQ